MTTAGSSSRRRSREVALQVLYALDVAAAKGEDPGAEHAFAGVAEHFEMPEAARAFARELVDQVTSKLDEIDAHIAAHSQNWRLSRMAAVDRNILRLGTVELCYTDTPVAVVVDEAVELARRFGGDPSPGFVNGVLDAIARSRSPAGGPRS
ncbi:MAG: transcription antitermination factor NusB [Proteobacteria bacterium]|nr:transcription antitermination factor NusB [Pseudomonadota bacterium]